MDITSTNERTFISRIQSKLKELSTKQRSLQSQLSSLEREKTEYEAALSVWAREMQNGARPKIEESLAERSFMDDELAGMTIANAAAFIMERFGGEAKVTDLAMMLQSTGVMKGNPNNAYSSVYKTLKRMPGRFQSIRRGVFSLAAPDAEAVAEELVHAEPSQ